MKLLKVLPVIAIGACTSGPSKDEAVQVFAAATTSMSSAQTRAVDAARAHTALVPGALTLDFSGPCTLGGTVAVTGSYDGTGNGSSAAFDLSTQFTGCHDAEGTLDGNLHWTSVATGTSFQATMTGQLDFTGPSAAASCGFDLALTVDATGVSSGGSLCGYDVQADLKLPHH